MFVMAMAVCRMGMVRMRCRRHDALDFRHGNRWQESAEQQEQSHKDTEAAEEHQSVVHRRIEVTPGTRQKVAAKRGNRNDESFEPHPDVHKDRNNDHRER